MKKNTIFVGLDVHKDSIDIALAEGERNSVVRYHGTIGGELADLDKAVKKFQKAHNITQAGYVGPSTRTELNKN